MKYTRYDFKRKNSNNIMLILVLFCILISAFFIGTIISNLLIKNNNPIQTVSKKPESVNISDVVASKTNSYIVIQGGKFLKQENVEQAKKIFLEYGNPFSIQEKDGTRLLIGIYKEDDANKLIKQLSDKNIETSKIIYQIKNSNDICNEEIIAMIDAELDVINKLNDKNIKSIQTDEIKKWCSQLQQVPENSINIGMLNDFKKHINSIPKDLTLDKVSDCNIYIYNVLKNLSASTK